VNSTRLYFSTITAIALINTTALVLPASAARRARISRPWQRQHTTSSASTRRSSRPSSGSRAWRTPMDVVFDTGAIAARNARLPRVDCLGIRSAGPALDAWRANRWRAWIQALSSRPDRALVDADGKPVAPTALNAVDRGSRPSPPFPKASPTRYGLVVHRARPCATFPTTLHVFSDLRRPLSAIHGLRGTWAPARRHLRRPLPGKARCFRARRVVIVHQRPRWPVVVSW